MTIKVTCPACDERYKLADDKAGKDVRCKRCNEVIAVPDPEAEAVVRRRPQPQSSSGMAPLFWILGIGGGVFVLLACMVLGGVALLGYGISNAASNVAADMPGAEPRDLNQALDWLKQRGGFKAENAAAWLAKQPVNAGRRAEVVQALDSGYQNRRGEVFVRDKFAEALAVWAGPGDEAVLIRTLDDDINDKVVDALVRSHSSAAAQAIAKKLNGLTFFKASDALKKMGPAAEDAVADVMLSGVGDKYEALRILTQIGTRKSIPKVQEAMRRDGSLDFMGKQAIQAMQNR